jgi:hypothetical protein
MKIRCPDFQKNNLSDILLFITLPLSKVPSDLRKRTGGNKIKGVRVSISKNKESIRFQIRISPQNTESIEILENLLNLIKKDGPDFATVIFQCLFRYDPDKYETDPRLPVEFPEGPVRSKILLSGVKLNFADPASSLKYTIIDMQYCLDCNTYHAIGNNIVIKENIPINAHFLLNAVKKAKQYSETFVKAKGD